MRKQSRGKNLNFGNARQPSEALQPHFRAWWQVQFRFQDDKPLNIAKALAAMNALEAEIIAEQLAAAQPKPHRYELTQEN